MSKTDQLNELFVLWEKKHLEESDDSFSKTSNGSNIHKNFFERDGIIDESAFEKEKIKVLFISAEANANDYNGEKGVAKTDYRQAYLTYFETAKDNWGGKMRERVCGMYKFLTNQSDKKINEMANKFAVMDINKRGGKSTIDKGKHLVEYTGVYKNFIDKEINIIDPDIVVLIGVNLCRLRIVQHLGCIEEKDKNYFSINGKKVPILLSFQTANVQFQAKRYPPLPECENKAIGILCAKLKEEMEKYGLL